MIMLIMSTETTTYPIYFSLIERSGEKTDRLIKEIRALSKSLNIYDEVTFVSSVPANNGGTDEMLLTYCIQINSPVNKKGAEIVTFLEYIFQKMFDKYPAFTEPQNL